jgi:outer membrane protein
MRSSHRVALLTVAAIAIGAMLFSQVATAQVKIGVIDLQAAVASTKAGKRAKSKLEKLAKKKQKELDDKVKDIQAMEENMKKQLPIMSDKSKQEMLEKYRKAGMELQELYMANQQEVAKKKASLLEPILTKMGAIIQDLALSDGYSAILDRSEGTVLYFDPATDLTSKIIKLYNESK